LSPSSKTKSAVVTVGSSHVFVSYPRQLGQWLDALVDKTPGGPVAGAWVNLEGDASPERFRVTASTGTDVVGLGLGDALAAFWERVTFLLVDRLADAVALHAAAVRRGNDLVLLPGASGAGKTQLALWYHAQGFALATDELVTLSSTAERSVALWASTLARPLFIKGAADFSAMLPTVGLRARHGIDGELLLVADIAPGPTQRVDAGFIVFPRYEAGSRLKLTALTPAQAALRLLEQCVNVRNLPAGGLALAAAVSSRLPALSLHYGETEQLAGTLDVLTRQVLAAPPSVDDLATLCTGFNAIADSRRMAVPAAAPTREDGTSALAPSPAQPTRRLTIGMATYDEYDGVFFTVQSIRLHHPELARAIEFIVIDNNPGGPCSEALQQLGNWIDGYRYIPRGDRTGTAIRDAVFEEAGCEIVLCVDPHVLIVPGALSRLVDYFQATTSRDLLQGPLLYDDLNSLATHFEPRWQAGMYGVWGFDPRGADPSAPAFEIPMQGLGLFACRRDAWPGFNRSFRGFGGEEGYIHEKIRQRGGRTLCLPFLRWVHRFSRPTGVPYPNRWKDRVRNYFIGFTELELDTAELEAHFAELLGSEPAARVFEEIRADRSVMSSIVDEVAEQPGKKEDSQPSQLSDEIYSPHNFSFGDQWATINYYLNMSLMKGQRIRVASLFHGVNLQRLHKEILDVLDSSGAVELTLSEPTVGVDGYNVWSSPYFHTKKRWERRQKHKYICMQFDSKSSPAANPTPEEELMIRTFLKERCHGVEAITLGKHLSIHECVDIAADSILFVGVDSGMSHLCHSVGVPIFLLEYGLPTITTHAGKAHVLCKGFQDFVGWFDRYANYLHAAGVPDAESISREKHDSTPPDPEAAQSSPGDAADGKGETQSPRLSLSDGDADDPVQHRILPQHTGIRRILSLLTPSAVINASKVRIGGEHDGGYLMIDDLQDVRVCYSLGIGFDISWDADMAERGAAIFQYDHTVTGPPGQHRAFHFRPVRIAPTDGGNSGNMRTIQTLLEENGHASETEMILKMDIEGAEWDVLDYASPLTLERFRQIVCEFHGFSGLSDNGWCERAERVLVKLLSTHAPVHVHGNNFGGFNTVEGLPIPDVLEVTFARRSSYSFESSSELFPTELDRPNSPKKPDIYLGSFSF
jgi:hypothetical protein